MCALGFDNYVDPLTLYLHKYRETTKTDRNINGGDTNASFEESTASDFSELMDMLVPLFGLFLNGDFSNLISDQSNARNGIVENSNITSNGTTIINSNGTTTANTVTSGGVVLGQNSILYYQNDQNQSFQI